MKAEPLVSVVVPTYNSEKFLERCLRSIRAQSYLNIELIVVDNYSTDATREIAKKFANLFLLKGPERSAQVNFGVRYANGEYVYRVDSDFVLERFVVEEAVRKCEDENFDAICVHNTSDPSISFWARLRKLERDCYANDYLNVAARFLRKEVFDSIGGFDEKMIAAEDYDLHNRLIRQGFKIGFVPSKELHIGEPTSLSEIVAKHYYYGKTLQKFLDVNAGRGKRQISPLRPALLKNFTTFANSPVLAMGFVVYQIVRYFAASLGYLIGEICR